MAARRGQSARAAAGTRAQGNKRGSPLGGPRMAALKPLLWGLLLVGALYFLGKWAGEARPAGGDLAPAAGDSRSGGSDPLDDPPDSAGEQPETRVPEPPPPAEAPSAADPGTNGSPSPTATTSAADQLAAARAHIDRSSGQAQTRTVAVYFVDLTRELTIQPVEIRLPFSQTPLKDVVLQWLQPPEDLELTSGVPAGTEVKGGLKRDGNAVVVDVTRNLYDRGRGGTLWANGLVYTLVYSLTEYEGIDKVQLTVNGFPADLEGWVWSRPIGRDELPGGTAFRIAPLIRHQP